MDLKNEKVSFKSENKFYIFRNFDQILKLNFCLNISF